MDSSRPDSSLRTLLPQPLARESAGTASAAGARPRWGGESSNAPSKGAVWQNLPKRRLAVVAACDKCRQDRAKCDTDRPCRRCLRLKASCTSDTTAAETHGTALKRRYTELSHKAAVQDELFNILRTKEDGTVAAVLKRLRAGQDVDAIVKLVADGELLLQCSLNSQEHSRYAFPYISTMPAALYLPSNPYSDSLLHHRTVTDSPKPPPSSDAMVEPWRVYDVPYHAATPVEPRLDRVNASRWTLVTSSDNLVQTLLRIYFKCEFPYQCFFHLDSFLDDLVAGRERYCSSLLVNAILAAACHGQTGVSDRSSFWDPHTLGYQFLAEARRRWELEKDRRNCVTTIQAGLVICGCCNMDGIDKVGSSYLAQAVAMGLAMGLFSSTFEDTSLRRRTAYAITAWSVFSWQSIQRFHFYQEPLLPEPPAIPIPEDMGELQVLYPHSSRPRAINHTLSSRAIFEYRAIINRIGVKCFGSGKEKGSLALREALHYHRELVAWMDSLPAPLSARQMVFPACLKLHMQYYNTLTLLFEPLTFTDQELPTVSPSNAQVTDPSPKEIVSWSKACMESVVRLYYLRHGFESWDALLVTSLHFVAFNALRDAATAADAASRSAHLSTVILCAKGLREQSLCCYIAEAIFIVLRDSMQPEGLYLLKEYAHIDDEQERKQLLALRVKSVYPVNVVSIADDPETKRLDILIRAWAGLRMDDSASESELSSTN